jgi:hypothetical protein
MAYFANGTEGDQYEAEFCEKCVHYEDPSGRGCMVWWAHLEYAYELVNQKDHPGKKILDMLIPPIGGGYNGKFPDKCRMFHPR